MKHLAYLNKYFIKYKWYLILGTLFTAISNLFGIIPAQVVRHALDLVQENIATYRLFEGSDLQLSVYQKIGKAVTLYGGLILIMALLKGVFLFLVRQTLIIMSRHIEFDLKNEIYAHYQTLPLSFYRKNKTGDLMARISEDVNKVRMYIGPSIMYLLNMITLVVLILSYMFSVNSRLTLWVLLPMPLLSLSIFYVSKIVLERSNKIQKSLSKLSSFVQESFSGIRIIKAFANEPAILNQFKVDSNSYKDESLNLTKVDALFMPTIMFLIGLSTVICVFIGGQEIIAGNLTPGNITEFIMYVYMLTWPLTALGWTSSQIQQAAASQKRINEFLEEKNHLVTDKNLSVKLKGEIEFKNVNFTYPESGIDALKNINFTIKPGQSLALLGTTGSGKSTLANLILRLYDSTSGTILIDDKPIKNYNIQNYREQIGYVPQDVFLFSDSIKNNIRFGNHSISEKQVIKAAKDADLYGNIMGFEEGFETQVGERGVTLSGGQKQRLSIARAIVRNPQLLIFDDCLSAVDTQTENIILSNLEKIMQGKTSIIIAHRVSSAKLANKIVFLDQGEIVEMGTHQELIEKQGAYFELHEKQTQKEEA